MNGDGENLLGLVLADDMVVEFPHDVGGFRHADGGLLLAGLIRQFLVEDAFADGDATVANVNTGTGDELAHLRVAFATEGTHREIAGPGHEDK